MTFLTHEHLLCKAEMSLSFSLHLFVAVETMPISGIHLTFTKILPFIKKAPASLFSRKLSLKICPMFSESNHSQNTDVAFNVCSNIPHSSPSLLFCQLNSCHDLSTQSNTPPPPPPIDQQLMGGNFPSASSSNIPSMGYGPRYGRGISVTLLKIYIKLQIIYMLLHSLACSMVR